jgi:hypothetical protein
VTTLTEGSGHIFPTQAHVMVISRDGASSKTLATDTYDGWDCLYKNVAFNPEGTHVAYIDGSCNRWLLKTDGTGEPEPLKTAFFWWQAEFYPQWGVEK